jgi:hypothetical protein
MLGFGVSCPDLKSNPPPTNDICKLHVHFSIVSILLLKLNYKQVLVLTESKLQPFPALETNFGQFCCIAFAPLEVSGLLPSDE